MLPKTTRIDDPKLEKMFFKILENILKKYHNKIELHLWKDKIPTLLEEYHNIIILHKGERNYKKFLRNFYNLGISIGLSPSLDLPFYHAKTNNKYREFAGCKIAGVYTNAAPYSNYVIDRQNGLLADNTILAWEEKISELIENENLRNNIAKNAFKDIQKNYKFEDFINVWKNDLLKITSSTSLKIAPTIKKFSEGIYVHESITTKQYDDSFKVVIFNVARILKASFNVNREWGPIFAGITKINTLNVINQVYISQIYWNSDLEFLKLNNIKFTGIILDCTKFKEQSFELVDEFYNSSEIPIFVIMDIDNRLLLNDFLNLKNNCFFIKTGSSDYFRIDGYYATYLSILENNFIFKKRKFISFSNIKFSLLPRLFSKVRSLWVLIKWLAGVRA